MRIPDYPTYQSEANTASAGTIERYRGRTDPEAIKAVAQEMEAMFANELLKTMRAASNSSSEKGLGASTYTSLFDLELSKLIAKRGLGLQDMLLKDIARKTAGSSGAGGEEASTSKNMGEPENASGTDAESVQNFLPVHGGKITSGFGMRPDPFNGAYKFHHGIDVAAPEGSDIRALKQGTVVFSGTQKGYGNVIIVDHGDGFVTKYAHNKTNLVQEGDTVTNDTVIAKVGNTGKSTGSHTHFEVIYNGSDVNPALALREKNLKIQKDVPISTAEAEA